MQYTEIAVDIFRQYHFRKINIRIIKTLKK